MKDPLSSQTLELFANNEYDFALGFTHRLSTNQLNAISFLFDQKGFKHLVVNDPKISKYSIIFLHYDNPEQFLKEAEKHSFLKQKYERKQLIERRKSKVSKLKEILAQKGAESLDPRVKQLETMGRFTFKERDLFLKEPISFRDGSASKQNKQQNKENEELNELDSLSTRAFSTQDIDLEILKERFTGISKTQIIPKLAQRKNSSIQTTEHDSQQRSFLKSSKYDYYNEYMSIFTPSEICQVVRSLLGSIEINTRDPSILEIFKISEKVRASFPNKQLIDILKHLKLLAFIRPLHIREMQTSPTDTNSMKDYFGPKVTIYFEYLLFYIKWLTVPAICGILNQYSLFDSKPGIKFWLDTIYCMVIMIWSAMFVRFWERKTNEIKVRWGTYGHNFKISNTRKDFKGKARVNPITELPELYVSPKTKLKKYIVSLLIHLPLFLLSLFVALLYLNVKGYSVPGHWIYFPEVARLAEPGQIFSKGSRLRIIPWVGRLLLKFIFKHMNNLLSDKTTFYENHRTYTGYNNSLITKRFLFGMVNTFTNLTYLAFWKLDLDALREELLTLYISDELKRLVLYSFLPFLRKKIFDKKIEETTVISKRSLSQHRHTEYMKLGTKEQFAAAERSLDLYIVKKVNEIGGKEYDMYKDYYEMVMQFGYITLFAVAFPLSGIISLLLNLVELRSDFFKLTNVIRRPMPESVDGIGAWLGAIKTMTYVSVITNSVLIANAAEFRTAMAQEIMEHPQIEGQEGKMLGIVFMVEHIMLVIIFLLRKLIEKQPTWVSVYVKRNLEKGSGLWAKIY